jgi:hypothetical protein
VHGNGRGVGVEAARIEVDHGFGGDVVQLPQPIAEDALVGRILDEHVAEDVAYLVEVLQIMLARALSSSSSMEGAQHARQHTHV